MVKFNSILYLSLSFLILFMNSCSSDLLDVDVSEIELKLNVIRLDEAVFSENWNDNPFASKQLKQKYKGYYDFYSQFILNNPSTANDSLMQIYMSRFANDPTMRQFYNAVSLLYGGDKFDPYASELTSAFKYFSYYFPHEEIPTLTLYQSGFNYKIVPNDTILGIGLEWYIGSDHELIRKLSNQAFPEFEKDKMQSKFLVVDAVKGFLKVKFQDFEQTDNLLSEMVFYGKILYLTDALLHHRSDADKMDYNEQEWEWISSNERQIWTYLAENDLLFEKNLRIISQWVNDGPFTTGLPQESPSRAGIFIGWKMVKQYMEKHPETTLQQLVKLSDYNKILSSYKPGK